MPLDIVQTAPVPAQAMHFNKCRGWSSRSSFLPATPTSLQLKLNSPCVCRATVCGHLHRNTVRGPKVFPGKKARCRGLVGLGVSYLREEEVNASALEGPGLSERAIDVFQQRLN